MFTLPNSLKPLFAIAVTLFVVGCVSAPPEAESFSLNQARYGHSAVADNEAIYVFGGTSEKGFVATIERIDPATKMASVLPVRLLPRRYATAVWDGDESIYIFGGVGVDQGRLRVEPTIEIFNTRTRKIIRTKMHLPRRFNSGARLDGQIYVVGGSVFDTTSAKGNGEFRATPLVTAYDFSNEQMNRLADLPAARDTQVFVYQNELCAIGGYDHTDVFARFDCYDPQTDSWTSLPDAPFPVSAHSVAVHDDTLYVFGDYSKLDQVLTFDFSNQRWSLPELPFQPSRHNDAVVFGDEVFVIGGTTDNKGPALDTIQVFAVGE